MKKLTGLLMALIMALTLFPSAYAADTAYTIDDVYFTNLSGGILENPTTSCLVNVELTKTAERLGEDIVVIASYSTDGAMIGFTTVAGTMEKGKTSRFSSLVVSPQDKSIGVVKAYVWNNISEMRTLSEVYMEIVNEMDEGVELPPVTQDPAEENYIPKVITARGIVAGTPLSDNLANGEYEISKLRIPYDLNTFDGIYTEDDYFALATRMEQISVIYDIPLATPYDGTYTVLSELDLCDYLKYEMEFELTLIDGDYVILDAQPLSLSGNVLKFDADDYVMQEDLDNSYQYSTSNSKIKFGSKYYRLEDEVEIYVNGVLTEMIYSESDITSDLTEAQYKLDAYLGNARGTITLLDDGVNSGYETISVDIWNVGKVSSVEYKNSETVVTIITREAVDVEYEEIVITDEAIENGDTILSVTRNGSETTLTALAKDDIIAYKTDFQNNTSATLRDPKQIEILATNDTVYGMVTAVDTDEETYSIDGTEYEYVTGLGTLKIGNTYTLSLDPFGRIYSSELDVLASYKMAIGLGITSTDQLKLLLSDGSTKSYDIISSVVITGFGDVDGDSISNNLSDVEAHLNNTENGPIDRVVEYSLSALQKITKIALTPADEDATLDGNEYTARTGKLGSCEILSTTPVIDAADALTAPTDSSSYISFNTENFREDSTYKYAAWKYDTYTMLVVLTDICPKFNDESRFAVVRKAAGATETYDGDEVDSVIVLYNGEDEAELLFNKELYADSGLGVGDAFFFETDNDGFVSDVFIVYDHDADAGSKFITLADAITASGFNVDDYLASDFEGWAYDLSNKEYKDIQLVEGYVISGADYVMTFAEVVSPLTNIDTTKEHKEVGDGGVATFIVDSDCHAYLYDTKNTTVIKTYDKFKNTANVSVLASTGLAKYEENGIYSSDSDMSGDANYAIAMIVDEVVVAVYAIK